MDMVRTRLNMFGTLCEIDTTEWDIDGTLCDEYNRTSLELEGKSWNLMGHFKTSWYIVGTQLKIVKTKQDTLRT